ncbi:hypothetical protein PCANC_05512 [Puccinia coronata f. sp. avenae]|uniref:Uncharacterized protein n=1 Tax=Puccinia coronata f. sp. avenae TaxID=200324 RepID=A0A2N5T6J8_9BASI|nr:hypothetical protein PCANC_05512 [Puccinia coronata f. sp. avenae]
MILADYELDELVLSALPESCAPSNIKTLSLPGIMAKGRLFKQLPKSIIKLSS